MIVLELIILFVTVVGSAYWRLPKWIWIPLVAVVFIGLSLYSRLPIVLLIICWLLYILAALFVLLTSYRIQYFTKPFVQILQKKMPPISVTEREAIESGDVWWEKELFCGRPHWKKLLAIPTPELSKEEQSFLDHQTETVCGLIDDWALANHERNSNGEVWNYLKKERFLGMIIPKEYGGLGFSALAHSTVVMKIATRSVSTAVNMMVPNSLGPAELLLHYGTTEQKNYYLPRLARGDEIPCFALTGPEAGSDAGAMPDRGIVCRGDYQGKQVLGIRLSWDKRYITLAPIATVLGLAFHLYDPDHLLGDKENIGITLCLLPTTHPGVEIGNRHLPMYLAFMNGPTRGNDVFIPMDWIIGGVAMAGQGWKMLMECLSIGRSISLPALSTACGKLAYRMTGAYARLRKQFNTAIANFEGIEEALGYISGYTYTLEAARIMTAGAVDQKIRPAIVSAIAKYHMTEMARIIAENAMDIHAGHQIQTGPRNFLANVHLAVPVSITVEGANILTRNLIIFGQGAIRCHPYILKEVNLLNSQDPTTIVEIDRLLLSHIGYTISNFVRTFWTGLTGGYLIISPVKGVPARYYRQLTRMSSALALLSDMAMLILGGHLKRKERTSARLGDILSQLYLGSTVLKYFHDHRNPTSDIANVRWSLDMCLSKIQVAIDDLLANFPLRWLGKILRFIVFPWGSAYRKPSDECFHQVVKPMLSPSELRERLTKYCYVPTENHASMRRIENALAQIDTIDPIWKKLQVAEKNGTIPPFENTEQRLQTAMSLQVITEDEMHSLLDYYHLYLEVIRVNEFSFDLQTVVF